MTASPIQIFNSAHDRAEAFINKKVGKKAKDDLRAAVVFSVAAIDAYFRVKIITHLKKQRDKDGSNFRLPFAAQKLVRESIALQNFDKDYKDLARKQQELVNTSSESNKQTIISYLEEALERESFQGIEKISEAFKIMGKTPSEIWGRFDTSSSKKLTKKKRKAGRPIKVKVGRKIDAKTQMGRLFSKRHLIVHQADIILTGRKSVGKERGIEATEVQKWLNSSKKAVREIDKIIS